MFILHFQINTFLTKNLPYRETFYFVTRKEDLYKIDN